MIKKKYTILTIITSLFLPQVVLAQQNVREGFDIIKEYFGGGDRDIRETIALLINQAMGLLGIVAVVIILYAGFLYMVSMGQEEKLKTARQTLYNGIIGLLIVLTSYSLANFIVNSIVNAT